MKTQKEIIKANNKKVRKAKKQNAKKLGVYL